ncbi:MAG: hypothetical protein QM687_16120 [Ferruginibacter sp.]
MQGIPFSEVEKLLNLLRSLKNKELFQLSEDQLMRVMQNEQQLHELYNAYQLSLKQVFEKVRQFEHHKLVIRKLAKEKRQQLKAKRKPAVSDTVNGAL